MVRKTYTPEQIINKLISLDVMLLDSRVNLLSRANLMK